MARLSRPHPELHRRLRPWLGWVAMTALAAGGWFGVPATADAVHQYPEFTRCPQEHQSPDALLRGTGGLAGTPVEVSGRDGPPRTIALEDPAAAGPPAPTDSPWDSRSIPSRQQQGDLPSPLAPRPPPV